MFTLPPVRTEHIRRLRPDMPLPCESGALSPMVLVLAMGWSWSLHLCQDIVTTAALRCASLSQEQLILDKQAAPPISGDSVACAIYVDNVGLIGTNKAEVNRVARDVNIMLESLDLQCKGVEAAGTNHIFWA